MTTQISYFMMNESRLIEFLIAKGYMPAILPVGGTTGRLLDWPEVVQTPINILYLFSANVVNHCSGSSDLFQSLMDTFTWISWVRCRVKADTICSGMFQFEIKSGKLFSDIEKTLKDDYKTIGTWFAKNTAKIGEDPWRGWYADPSKADLEGSGFILKS